jgi:hypothetical protein
MRRSASSLILLFAILLTGALYGCRHATDESSGTPAVRVAPSSGSVGDAVRIAAEGFAPGAELVVGGGPPQSEYDVLTRVTANARGEVDVTLNVPAAAGSHDRYVFVVATPDARTKASAEIEMERRSESGSMTVTGVLTAEGVECPAMRGDDGTLYTLTMRDLGGLRTGDRVRVTGSVAEMSFCMQGTTINVASIERVGAKE